MKNKNIFITGGNGFIGRHLCDEIKGDDIRMYMLILPDEKPQIEDSRIIWISGDLNITETYSDALSVCDTVIHMAAELHNPERFEQINVTGVENILRASKRSKIERFIHLSSVGVVGMQFSTSDIQVDEKSECHPQNEYERTKLISEKILREGFDEKKLVILRPTNVFGEIHPRQHLLSLMRHISAGKTIYMSRNAKVNYVYVKDVTASIAFFFNHPHLSGIYNIGEPMHMSNFIQEIAKACNTKCKIVKISTLFGGIVFICRKIIPSKIFSKILSLFNRVSYSGEKLANQFVFPYGIVYGLKKTADYYKKNGQLND